MTARNVESTDGGADARTRSGVSEDLIGLHSLKPAPGSRRPRKRVGRGEGSGTGKTVEREDSPQLRGMVHKVRHLVEVEEK